MAPADKSSSSEPLKREAGGGCPPPSCSYPSTRYNSPNADCSSTASSCCSSQCRYPSSHRTFNCQPCALKSILKKRNCCQSNAATTRCLCQPIPRGCNCPPPIQVDVRAARECSCDYPSSPECACPPSERRFPKATIKCPNARICYPSPRLPPGPKCHCPCQPCPPPSCNPCTSFKCRRPVLAKDSCQFDSSCPSCPPDHRPISTTSPCRPPTPCRKLTFCTERNDRFSSPSCTVGEMTCWRAFPFTFLTVLVFCATFRRGAPAVAGTVENKSVTEKAQPEGCIECGYYRCPENPGKCLLGSVPDPCGCCPETGLCARLLGEPCWNASIPLLSPKSRNDGYCARNYLCELRSDLQEKDTPQAACVCMEQSPACGSNNETYSTPCALHEEAMKLRNSSSLRLQHLGPCESRPWILSTLEDVVSPFGQRVALNCEAKGFPVPDIFWEFHSADGKRVLKLPGEEHQAIIHTSDGPEPLMRTSWMQLARLDEEHMGMYYCIANNSIGEASTSSFVSVL
ncbi:Kazal-type serine protease inhibitor domain-containing protein 1 [Cyphomyrmex costatus]|uniref:Kazal-type serine protease inhibitor domain-containing protein 1 n=1 Tax=Cyphomyrmex costatus TaxID=456900 RepID=A0A151I8M8_9HYME|nr:Kazal-type serine protease inhibitor domain-containing protein 1 [Cyphomyrmex costatus]